MLLGDFFKFGIWGGVICDCSIFFFVLFLYRLSCLIECELVCFVKLCGVYIVFRKVYFIYIEFLLLVLVRVLEEIGFFFSLV